MRGVALVAATTLTAGLLTPGQPAAAHFGEENELHENVKLTAADGEAGDFFGASVALDGNTAVVGAYFDDTPNGADAGSAYVLTRTGGSWSQKEKLTPSDGAEDDLFGFSVALDGDTAIVGGLETDAAYVFTRTAGIWSQQQKLTPSDAQADDGFGFSVALDGDTALVGRPADDTAAGGDAGSAYVFTRTAGNWSEEQKLTASDAESGDRLGRSVALEGDTAVIGGWGGAAYVFARTEGSWSEEQKLTPSDGNEDFGSSVDSVALDGDSALIGGFGAGAAYVFTRTAGNWSEEQKLTASDGGNLFGLSVALDGDRALISAPTALTFGGSSGSAYLFTRTAGNWSEEQKLVASDADSRDWFGVSVALQPDMALVGAEKDDTSDGTDAGSAYVFLLSPALLPAQPTDPLLHRELHVGQWAIDPAGFEYAWAEGLDASAPTEPVRTLPEAHHVSFADASPSADWTLLIRAFDEHGNRTDWRTAFSGVTPGKPWVIALGDSVPSGHNFDHDGGSCFDKEYGYPHAFWQRFKAAVPSQWERDMYRNLARSGFGTKKIVEGGEDACGDAYASPLITAVQLLSDNDRSWNRVIITAGINNTNWSDVLRTIVINDTIEVFGPPGSRFLEEQECRRTIEFVWNGYDEDKQEEIREGISEIQRQITEADAEADVTWTGYHNIAGTGPLSHECEEPVQDALDVMNGTLQEGLIDQGVHLLSSDRVLHMKDELIQSFWSRERQGWPHPNQAGAQALADVFEEWKWGVP